MEKDQAYFISLNPLLETGFRWTGRTGTQISATAYDNMYTIRFHDKKEYMAKMGQLILVSMYFIEYQISLNYVFNIIIISAMQHIGENEIHIIMGGMA